MFDYIKISVSQVVECVPPWRFDRESEWFKEKKVLGDNVKKKI